MRPYRDVDLLPAYALDRETEDFIVLYPDAGHGGIFQYHELFADRAIAFLDA